MPQPIKILPRQMLKKLPTCLLGENDTILIMKQLTYFRSSNTMKLCRPINFGIDVINGSVQTNNKSHRSEIFPELRPFLNSDYLNEDDYCVVDHYCYHDALLSPPPPPPSPSPSLLHFSSSSPLPLLLPSFSSSSPSFSSSPPLPPSPPSSSFYFVIFMQ
ncbi:hypothetical protein MAR_001442 [Mya arenaria]|uniref:Uncharacterized protein n=1 Tax=Mya arenaria TaxID=6604 RepID=A0ABY7FE26_MYAAR|nr:hypothetical protein MAR_001442 [Mya arenaria]